MLNDIVNKYNSSYHRSIKMKPIEVNKDNEPLVWINLYDNKVKNSQAGQWRNKFFIGNLVQISVERGSFKKGCLEGWSEELFVVKHVVNNNPTVYKLQDQVGEDIKGTFYAKELQKVAEPESYRIEKVIPKESVGARNILCFVKWKSYPDKFNSFMQSEDLKRRMNIFI